MNHCRWSYHYSALILAALFTSWLGALWRGDLSEMVHTIVAVEPSDRQVKHHFLFHQGGPRAYIPSSKGKRGLSDFNMLQMHLILNVQVSQKPFKKRGLARASLISPVIVLVVDLLMPLRQLNVCKIFPVRGSDVCYVCNVIMLIRLQKSSEKWDNFGGRRCTFVILLHVQLSVSGGLDKCWYDSAKQKRLTLFIFSGLFWKKK